VTADTQLHLDRCLTCRACESTCPSGVQYGRLVDIGRDIVDRKVPRRAIDRLQRALLKTLLPQTRLFKGGLAIGRVLKPLLPAALGKKMPTVHAPGRWPPARHARKMLVLDGCVQPAMAPNINAASARVLDALGISLIVADKAGCCGAIPQHLSDPEQARVLIKRNIDAWWPAIEQGAEAIIVTASGCGTLVAEYGHMLRDDPAYAGKAARVSALFRDISQVIAHERVALLEKLPPPAADSAKPSVAFHAPCSLQHGLQIKGVVEDILRAAGYVLTTVPEGHLCCGSAGTYSLLQPELAQQLLVNKVRALESGAPQRVATANIGCLAHLEAGLNSSSKVPIRHWIELIDGRLQEGR
jgi:glycolate oxidase iron-sulfur subunit